MTGVASGIQSQLGLKAETTVGTRVVPDRFFEFTKESLKGRVTYKNSNGIRAGRFIRRRRSKMQEWCEGDVEFEFAPQSTALVWKHTLGTDVITGAGPYTHTFGYGPLDLLSLTIQVNRVDSSGTDRPFDYLGCQITRLRLAAKVGDFLMGTMSVYGSYEDTSQSLASASYPSSWTPYTFVHGVLSIAGSAYDIWDISIDIPTGLATGRHQIRSTTPSRPKPSLSQNTRDITGVLTSDFVDLTAYNRAKNQTAASLSLVFTSGTNVLTISGNVEFDVDTPTVQGEDVLKLTLPFTFLHATSDTSGFSVVLVNGDAAT